MVAEFLEVSECVLDFRGRPSATLLCIQWPRKAVPFHPARALASTTKRAPKQTGISMVTRNYQG